MKYKKSVFRNLAMVTQLGISVLAPIFLCIFIGYQVDSRYGMKTLVPLLILGVLAGAKSAWHLAMRTLMQECREDEAILQERERARRNEPEAAGRSSRAGFGGISHRVRRVRRSKRTGDLCFGMDFQTRSEARRSGKERETGGKQGGMQEWNG